MIYIILSGFVFALLLPLLGKQTVNKFAIWTTLLPLAIFAYLIARIDSEPQSISYNWVPSLGINLDITLDGLSLLFGLIISGIGTLVFFYSSYYLKGHEKLIRFYAFLSAFMAAMLGLVFSNNIFTTFIFWEITSITSFFLIGFNNESASSRKSAVTALTITGIGGLFLLAFAVLIGYHTGTYQISEMLDSPAVFQNHWIGNVAMLFLLLAAFTKSAQFPFHFWLPGAMKAPTPVSTYLHSATMVKAGVFLLLRFSPHFTNHPGWQVTLIVFGSITMLYAAIQILFKTDLKSILAYSTISALGILVFLIGIGTPTAITAALVFLVVHALYKAALFLITGIIDHQTGTRDITKLSGLGKLMTPVAIAGALVAFSSAGVPPFYGFIGKDLIYESSLHADANTYLLTTLAFFTNLLLVFAGFLVGIKPFLGKLPNQLSATKKPSFILSFPPMILAILSLLFGFFPNLISDNFVYPFVSQSFNEVVKVKLWHGFNLILLISLLTLLSGIILYLIWKINHAKESWHKKWEKFSPSTLLTSLAKGIEVLGFAFTKIIQNGYLRNYVLVLVLIFSGVLAYYNLNNAIKFIHLSDFNDVTINDAIVVGIMLIAILFTVFSRSRLAAIAGLGVVGYAMCFVFVFYSAPDLAMTQFTIDTLTVILFVLVLYRLPKYLNMSNYKMRIRDGIIALFLGTMITLLMLNVLHETPNKEISKFYADNAYVLAKGKNIVNVILVDFRGFDTLVEVIVLAIAALGVFGLLKLHLKRNEK